MKRKMSSSNKRKWVLTGALLFGGVALLTTGFATWVIGSMIRNVDNGGTSVTVDTYTMNGMSITYEMSDEDNSLNFAEKSVVTGGSVINTSPAIDPEGDFTITFKSITVEIGKSALAEKESYDGVRISLPTEMTDLDVLSDAAKTAIVGSSNVAGWKGDVVPGTGWVNDHIVTTVDEINKRDVDNAQLIELSSVQNQGEGSVTVTRDSDTVNSVLLTGVSNTSEDSNYERYVYENVVITFNWGDFYKLATESSDQDRGPAAYYNATFPNGATLTEQSQIASEYDELAKLTTAGTEKLYVLAGIATTTAA